MDAITDFITDWVVVPFVVLTMGALGVAMFVGIPYGIYYWATYKPPETFSLRVDSWKCSLEHEQQYETCGAKTGCQWNTRDVCDQWTKR